MGNTNKADTTTPVTDFVPGQKYPYLRKKISEIPQGYLLAPDNTLLLNSPETRRRFKQHRRHGRCYNVKPKCPIANQQKETKDDQLTQVIQVLRENPAMRRKVQRMALKSQVKQNPNPMTGGARSRAYQTFLDAFAKYKLPVNVENRLKRVYNFRWRSLQDFQRRLEHIHEQQERGYLMNVSFSYMLTKESDEAPETRIFYARDNNGMFEPPYPFVQSQDDLQAMINEIQRQDPVEWYRNLRPNSQWQFQRLLDFSVMIFPTNFPIGSSGGRRRRRRHEPLRFIPPASTVGNMCFWECLGRFLQQCAVTVFRDFYSVDPSPAYPGATLLELGAISAKFRLNISLFIESPDTKSVSLFKRFGYSYGEVKARTMRLLLENTTDDSDSQFIAHVSLITNFQRFTKTFRCEQCGYMTRCVSNLECRHRCESVKLVGGFYEPPQSIFDRLRAMGVQTNRLPATWYPYFVVFRCITQWERTTQQSQTLKLVGIEATCNVPALFGTRLDCPHSFPVEDGNVQQCLDRFVIYCRLVQSTAQLLLNQAYRKVFVDLASIRNRGVDTTKLFAGFAKWIEQLPIVSWDGARLDYTLVFPYLRRSLIEHGFPRRSEHYSQGRTGKNVKVIKSGTRYRFIATDIFRFLDLQSYCDASAEVEDFVQAYTGAGSRGDLWSLCSAVDVMLRLYGENDMDIFKEAMSLSGVVERYLSRGITVSFPLFRKEEEPLFHLFKSSIVAGQSCVYTHFAKVGVTGIRDNPAKRCQSVVGYDANSLYLWCLSQELPAGQFQWNQHYQEDVFTFTQAVQTGELFGFAVVDISTPTSLEENFVDFPPIFKKADIVGTDIGNIGAQLLIGQGCDPNMYRVNKVVQSYYGNKILLFSPLLKWYLDHGLKVNRVYEVVTFDRHKPYESFVEEMAKWRQVADQNPEKALQGHQAKLMGNCAYGRLLMDGSKFSKTTYVDAHSDRMLTIVHQSKFKDANLLDESTYEVTNANMHPVHNRPIYVAKAVYDLAKLRVLEWYYDFLCQFVKRENFELLYHDTDSFYLAIAGQSLDDIVEPSMQELYQTKKKQWLVTDVSNQRQPGIFKLENSAQQMYCLAPKAYGLVNLDGQSILKQSGIDTSRLSTDDGRFSEKRLFGEKVEQERLCRRGSVVELREVKVNSFRFFNDKRRVLDDFRRTLPLRV